MNIDLGDHVPLGAGRRGVARRIRDRPSVRCAASPPTACCARHESWDSVTITQGLMLLDDLIDPVVGVGLLEALSITPDVVFDITVEGNRPDAWSVEGVARDLATRLGRPLASPALAETNGTRVQCLVRGGRYRRPRPLRPTHGVGAAPRQGRVRHRRGSSPGSRARGCARSRTWSTPRTS